MSELETTTVTHAETHGILMSLLFCSAVPILAIYQRFRADLAAVYFSVFVVSSLIVAWGILDNANVTRRLEEESIPRQLYGLSGYESYQTRHQVIGKACFWFSMATLVIGFFVSLLRVYINNWFMTFLAYLHFLVLCVVLWLGPVTCWTGADYITLNENMRRSPGVWLAPSIVAFAMITLNDIYSFLCKRKSSSN